MSDPPPPLPLGQHDAAIGLPARIELLPSSTEPEVLGVVDAALLQYGPWALYEMARQFASEVVRQTRAFAAYVEASPHPEARAYVWMFLCVIAKEIRGGAVTSAQKFHEMVHWAGEQIGRKVVCSLLCIVRWARLSTETRTAVPLTR